MDEEMLRYEKLWYGTYFTGTYVFLLVPRESAFLYDSVRYQNIRSRDPITLLSMDIVVETFLEIGVSDVHDICKTHRIWNYEKHNYP